MLITISSTGGKRLYSFKVPVKTIKTKMLNGQLSRKTIQMAALEHVRPSLDRRIPSIMENEDYSVSFKRIFV